MIKRMICLCLALCLLAAMPLTVQAAGNTKIENYAKQLIQYYYHHQNEAEDVIWDILRQMEAVDRHQAAVWRNIMEDWAWVNNEMPVGAGVLPDGLPEDESLCIVVLGYGLKEDGSMKQELVDRLVVALASALKYPNASVVVTGGQTSEVEGVTEAGRMAAWLKKKGIDAKRIIEEKQSLSTTANAVNVYKLLNQKHPQIRSVAIITSDYHAAWGSAMFAAVSNYKFGYDAGNPIDVVAAAVCDTGSSYNSMAQQAWGVSIIAGLEFEENTKAPALYPVERSAEPETVPTETVIEETREQSQIFWQPREEADNGSANAEAAEKERWSVVPVLIGSGVLAGVYVLMPKRPQKRKRRKKPKMDWS